MKRTALLSMGLLAAIVVFYLAPPTFAYWVWTPETGRWVNPRYSVKETDQEQLDWALSFYEEGDYRRALSEFRKLVRHYRNSPLAGEGQYYLGMSYEKLGEFYRAYQTYRKLVQEFPESGRINEAIAAEFRMGEIYLGRRKNSAAGGKTIFKPALAVEIFREVITQAPFGSYGDQSQYLLGAALMECGRFREARDEFERMLEEYPESPLTADARFWLATCLEKVTPEPGYTQEPAREAIAEFNRIIETSSDQEKIELARKELKTLEEKQAESLFQIARFYEIQKKRGAAATYYQEIIDKYPATSWVNRARKRLEAVKPETN